MVLSTSAAKLWEFSSCVYIAGHRPYKLVVTMATRPRPHPGAPFDPTDREPPRLLVTPPTIRKRTLTRKRKRHSANNKMRDSQQRSLFQPIKNLTEIKRIHSAFVCFVNSVIKKLSPILNSYMRLKFGLSP